MNTIFFVIFFFFNDPATTEIYTLSLHDALPIFEFEPKDPAVRDLGIEFDDIAANDLLEDVGGEGQPEDRKSTRLNSSHANISYAVFCLKKKKKNQSTHALVHNVTHHPQLSKLQA